jgi:hypothetical protein
MKRHKFILIVLWVLFGFKPTIAQSRLILTIDQDIVVSNETFDLNLQLENVTNLFAVSFDLRFDSALLDFVSSQESQFLSEDGEIETIFMTSEQGNRIILGITRLNVDDGGISTDEIKTFASLKFKAKLPGNSLFTIENPKFIDPQLHVTYPIIQYDTVLVISPPVLQDDLLFTLLPNETRSFQLDSLVVDLDTPINRLDWEIAPNDLIDTSIDTIQMTLNFKALQPFVQTQLHIKVTDPEGLSDETDLLILQPSSLTNADQHLVELKVYPNPFTDRLSLILKGKQIFEKPKISIYRIDGTKVGEVNALMESNSNEIHFTILAEEICKSAASSEQYILFFETHNFIIYKNILFIHH